jgi:hypothetical protein
MFLIFSLQRHQETFSSLDLERMQLTARNQCKITILQNIRVPPNIARLFENEVSMCEVSSHSLKVVVVFQINAFVASAGFFPTSSNLLINVRRRK